MKFLYDMIGKMKEEISEIVGDIASIKSTLIDNVIEKDNLYIKEDLTCIKGLIKQIKYQDKDLSLRRSSILSNFLLNDNSDSLGPDSLGMLNNNHDFEQIKSQNFQPSAPTLSQFSNKLKVFEQQNCKF